MRYGKSAIVPIDAPASAVCPTSGITRGGHRVHATRFDGYRRHTKRRTLQLQVDRISTESDTDKCEGATVQQKLI